MKLSLCTISFRHHLMSITDIAKWAAQHQFDGIELWGIHAINLADKPRFNAGWLVNMGLSVPMISDYLPVDGKLQNALDKIDLLSELGWRWNCRKIRTFAGQTPSSGLSLDDKTQIAERLQKLAERAEQHGMKLLIETHPNTLADNSASTLELLSAVNHSALAVNFDVLHLWEAGEDPNLAWQQLKPYVAHLHLKNIRSSSMLNVFAPANVYAAAGSREGMVPLFEGAMDYQRFLQHIAGETELEASLEWFGHDVQSVLQNDCRQIQRFFDVFRNPANEAVVG
jgi:3-dehydroshikimate dehydratase